jgi:hypothetical protein
MYIFNFNEGFTVVSATRNIHMSVLAYATEGEIVINDPNNVGLSIWMDITKTAIEESIENQIDTFLQDVEDSETEATTTRSAIFFNEIRNHRRVNPLLTTRWHQDAPFNNHAPLLISVTNGIERAAAGCVPIAIAQVVNFHRRLDGHNIDWAAIGRWEDNARANLIRVISQNVEMLYLPDGTSPMVCFPDFFCYRNRIVNFLNRSGYHTNFVVLGNQRPTTLPAIYEGFKSNFIGGTNWFGGHWWVVDGYETWERWYGWGHIAVRAYLDPGRPGTSPPALHPPLTVTSHLLLHFNWGWGGQSNGWFGVAGSYLDFSKQFKRLDIRPK